MKKFFLLLMICLSINILNAKDIKSVENSIKKVKIGMKMKKVISLMGADYELISAKESVLVLAYTTEDKGRYKLVFAEEKLKELSKDSCRCHGKFPWRSW